jgi:hypothetical protein
MDALISVNKVIILAFGITHHPQEVECMLASHAVGQSQVFHVQSCNQLTNASSFGNLLLRQFAEISRPDDHWYLWYSPLSKHF